MKWVIIKGVRYPISVVSEEIPCPFCRTEEFIRYDPFNKEYSMDSEEDIKDWYMSYINEMRNKYGGK